MARIAYPSDLTDAQWRLIEKLIPRAKPGGRPRSVNMREVVNGILYLVRTGCSWRQLPHDFPPWGTVHYYYRRFRLEISMVLCTSTVCSLYNHVTLFKGFVYIPFPYFHRPGYVSLFVYFNIAA